jgi:hypothetical protein
MALLSTEDQQHYRLLHNKQYIAVCDKCGLGIPAGDLYVVKAWKARKDKLLFLGAIPTDVRCMLCANIESGKIKVVDGLAKEKDVAVAKEKPKKRDMIGAVRRGVLKILATEKPKHGYTSEELILKLYRRKSMHEHKKGEIKKTLSLMKKFRDLKKSEDKWRLA